MNGEIKAGLMAAGSRDLRLGRKEEEEEEDLYVEFPYRHFAYYPYTLERCYGRHDTMFFSSIHPRLDISDCVYFPPPPK